MVPPLRTRTPAPSSAPDWTASTRDSSIAIVRPGVAFGEDLGKLAAVGERPRQRALGHLRLDHPAHGFGRFPATSISDRGDEELGADERVAGVIAGTPTRVERRAKGLAGDPAAAHVGSRLVGVAGDAVEE